MGITDIEIANYRAFLNITDSEKYKIELPNGENLLLYGENGSGKSSLYNGVRDFIYSARMPELEFTKNEFYQEEDLSDKPFIRISFKGDSQQYFFSSEKALTNTPNCPHIKLGSFVYGFLSYRDLIKLHFSQGNEEIDYFLFFYGNEGLLTDEILLTPKKPQHKISYKELWKIIKLGRDKDALEDFNLNAAALIATVQDKVNKILKYFEKSLNIGIDFIDGEIGADLIAPKILFNITLFKKRINRHHNILNEARLTSVAISVYFSHLLSLPDYKFKFLFLDDIFLGLDMSNRIPLLDILTTKDIGDGTSFKDFQIFITTYDKEWYEIAKIYLKSDWKQVEFIVDDHSSGVERPFIKSHESYLEIAKFHLLNADYPACANYLRKAFEKELRRILPSNILYPGVMDQSEKTGILDISRRHFELLETTEAWLFRTKKEDDLTIPRIGFIGLETLMIKFESLIIQYNIPFEMMEKLRSIKNRLLNPLSHDDIKSPIYKKELLLAFEILEEFLAFESKIILSTEGLDSILLTASKVNFLGKNCFYRFELLENLRYVRYKALEILLSAKCRSLYKCLEYGPIEVEEHEYMSLERLCKGVYFDSSKPSERPNIVFDTDFQFNSVITEQGKKLRDLI